MLFRRPSTAQRFSEMYIVGLSVQLCTQRIRLIHGPMDQHRHCKCGAVYRRTEQMAPRREMSSFECAICGDTLESWNTAWVPSYRLVVGPVVKTAE
jgi:hypothetical protein